MGKGKRLRALKSTQPKIMKDGENWRCYVCSRFLQQFEGEDFPTFNDRVTEHTDYHIDRGEYPSMPKIFSV